MPIYSIPRAQNEAPGVQQDPILEAAKNFMQSPAYARQFMGNLDGATAPSEVTPAFGGGGGNGHAMGDGHDHAGGKGLTPQAIAAFGNLSSIFPDLTVNSAYRDPAHNARVGGAKNSQHTHGNAYDISTAGMSQDQVGALIDAAQNSGFRGIGVYDNSVHFDVGPERAWGPSYGHESLPGWAAPYIAR